MHVLYSIQVTEYVLCTCIFIFIYFSLSWNISKLLFFFLFYFTVIKLSQLNVRYISFLISFLHRMIIINPITLNLVHLAESTYIQLMTRMRCKRITQYICHDIVINIIVFDVLFHYSISNMYKFIISYYLYESSRC